MKVRDIIKAKGDHVVTVKPRTRIESLCQLLKFERIGAAVISDDDHTLSGIISERAVVFGLAQFGCEMLGMPVSKFMTPQVATCSLDDDIKSVMKTMTLHRYRHVPVVNGKKIVGIVSIGDIVKCRLEEMEFEANVLRDVAIARH